MKDYRSILITRFGGMGDMLFLSPALHNIRFNFPNANISLIAAPFLCEILREDPNIDQLIEVRDSPFNTARRFTKLLKPYNFDLAINFNPHDKLVHEILAYGLKISACWSLIIKGSSPLDYNRYHYKDFVFYPWDAEEHCVKNYLSLIKKAGLSIISEKLRANVGEDKSFIDDLFYKYGLKPGELLIALHPGVSGSNIPALLKPFAKMMFIFNKRTLVNHKIWKSKYYAELADLLHRKLQAKIIITGGKYEKRVGRKISKKLGFKPINLCGKTTFKQLATLYKSCTAVIGSDSGPLHLAAAVNTPVVGLYGHTDPSHTGPWMENSRFKVIQSGFEHGSCQYEKKLFWRAICMDKIKPVDVFNAIKELLGRL